jgi:rhodanese-related sulfurtransferase
MKKLLALFATTVLAVTAQAGEYPDISVTDLKAAIEAKKATVIDVNGTASYQKGHVPTAIDYAAVKDNLAKSLPADKGALVVAYCGGPTCGAYAAAAKAAKELGYTNVKHMSAGISGWMQAGEKTEKTN